MSLQCVDFLHPPRAPRLGWGLSVVGLLALGGAALCHQRWAIERAAAEQQVRHAAEARQALQKPKLAAVLPADERRALRALHERSRPWLAALRAVESATRDPIYLLSMTVDAKSGHLKLEGEAPSFEHALAYVQVLPDGEGLVSAHLQSHEQAMDAATGRRIVRFAVVAQWGRR